MHPGYLEAEADHHTMVLAHLMLFQRRHDLRNPFLCLALRESRDIRWIGIALLAQVGRKHLLVPYRCGIRTAAASENRLLAFSVRELLTRWV